MFVTYLLLPCLLVILASIALVRATPSVNRGRPAAIHALLALLLLVAASGLFALQQGAVEAVICTLVGVMLVLPLVSLTRALRAPQSRGRSSGA